MKRTEVILVSDAKCEFGEHDISAGSHVWVYYSWKRTNKRYYWGQHHTAFMCDNCYKKKIIFKAMEIEEK